MITVEDLKQRWLNKELEIGTSVNEDGENVVVLLTPHGFEIHTNQTNGWVRIDSYEYLPYDEDPEVFEWVQGESYDGKWK